MQSQLQMKETNLKLRCKENSGWKENVDCKSFILIVEHISALFYTGYFTGCEKIENYAEIWEHYYAEESWKKIANYIEI